jgi:hypothetical protein
METITFRAMLDKAGVKHVYFESPGTAHEWLTWRRDLNDLAPRLFRSRRLVTMDELKSAAAHWNVDTSWTQQDCE